MKGFWRTSIFTSGPGIIAPLKEETKSARAEFHKKSLMLLEQERSSYENKVRALDLIELRM